MLLWLGAIALGIGLLTDYAATPGDTGAVPQRWPTDAPAPPLALAPDRLTVLVAVHPRCPCTRATINELQRAIAAAPTEPAVYALVYEPTRSNNPEERFARTSITKRLTSLPSVTIVPDPDARIAESFGALTSGHTLVYDPSGSLRYSGGLTPTRAHEGPNTGAASLVDLLHQRDPVATRAPVYGCPLCNDTPHADTLADATPEDRP